MVVASTEMMYLGRSGLELACSSDDVLGMVVVDPNGLRLGVVEDVVIDAQQRRARLLSVVSGGVLGLSLRHDLLPVETVTRVDDRVRVDRSHADVHAHLGRAGTPSSAARRRRAPGSFAEVYDSFGLQPFWVAAPGPTYFHSR